MPRYSEERKAAVLQKLLPPHNRSVSDVVREEGISEQYGPITQALAVYLYQYQLEPYKRISQFVMDIFGLEVSPGSICTFQKNAYEYLVSTEQVIADAFTYCGC